MAWGSGAELIGPEGSKGPEGDKGETGATGSAGEDGAVVWQGSGPPGEGLGAVGDFYIDTLNHLIYGPKT